MDERVEVVAKAHYLDGLPAELRDAILGNGSLPPATIHYGSGKHQTTVVSRATRDGWKVGYRAALDDAMRLGLFAALDAYGRERPTTERVAETHDYELPSGALLKMARALLAKRIVDSLWANSEPCSEGIATTAVEAMLSFDGLMAVAAVWLDEHYPADASLVCDKDSPDPGPRLVAALRDCLTARGGVAVAAVPLADEDYSEQNAQAPEGGS